ncbi:uncharacterized protein LOC135714153 [Ochlerotatus camptorhynchus]|uniref:uncharacterized protein LOC135714153 n=1 Tax=Ochlerotatus camptorhynchus TaxID=644619 RepID=UPI0031DB02AF
MASVSPSSPVPITGRQTSTRKTPSPYRLIPSKNRYIKSPNKVSRNNTFIATSRRSEENGGNGHRLVNNDRNNGYQYKVKCSSAGAVEGLKPEQREDDCKLVDVFNRDDIKFSGSEEDRQQPTSDTAPSPAALQPIPVIEEVHKKPSSIPVKTKSFVGRSQRSIKNGNSESKTIKFLLKLTTKSYFETLKYEIDRIKENDRKIQDQASSHAHSIMALISKGVDLDHQMRDLRIQNTRLLFETKEKDRIQQDTIKAITCELNELKSICNLLLKNIEKDHELEILARKLRKSKRFDSNTYKMLKSQLRKPICLKSVPKLPSIKSLPARTRGEKALKRQKSKASCRSSARQKSDWSSMSSISSVVTGSDMLTDIESTSAVSQKSTKLPMQAIYTDQNSSIRKQIQPKKRSGLMKIFCCGGRSKQTKEDVANSKIIEA